MPAQRKNAQDLSRLRQELDVLVSQSEFDAQNYLMLGPGDLPNGFDMSLQEEIVDEFAETAAGMNNVAAQAQEGAERMLALASEFEALARQAESLAEATLGLGVQAVERARQVAENGPGGLSGIVERLEVAL